MAFVIRNDASHSVIYGDTDLHAFQQLRQSRCLATMRTFDCAPAGVFDAGLPLGRLADPPVRASSVYCQQNLLVSFQCNLWPCSKEPQFLGCTAACMCRCCPFILHIWRAQPWLTGQLLRLGFETTYTINVLRRLLTLPIRPHFPGFYIVGFAVRSLAHGCSGPLVTVYTLANQLQGHLQPACGPACRKLAQRLLPTF